jgi:myo-inositol-1(or 4)-monophosphatase
MNARPPNNNELLACAVSAAQAAGDHAHREWHRRDEVLEVYAHDVKLVLDREAQDQAESVIRAAFPAHAILGEEGVRSNPDSAYRWIIDPIDGTVNFSHGIPYWCSSIAVEKDGETVAGVVHAPALRRTYTATAEGPAQLNGEPIRASETRSLGEALICTGLSKYVDEISPAFEVFRVLITRAQKVRVLGAAALDICHVASGDADGYVEYSIYLWDVAAAGFIARRAGVETRTFDLRDDYQTRFLCANRFIFEDLQQIYEASWRRAGTWGEP